MSKNSLVADPNTGVGDNRTVKPRGVRTDDAEIVAQAAIIKQMAAHKAKIDDILGHLPDAATVDRVLFWMEARFGKAAQIGEFAEKE